MSGLHTPMAVEDPGALLAFLATVLRPPAAPALGELPGELLPLPALVVCTLPYPTPAVVLPAEVPHNDPGPVLHILAVVSDGKFFDEWEDVKIVRKKILFFFRVAGGGSGGEWIVVIAIKKM